MRNVLTAASLAALILGTIGTGCGDDTTPSATPPTTTVTGNVNPGAVDSGVPPAAQPSNPAPSNTGTTPKPTTMDAGPSVQPSNPLPGDAGTSSDGAVADAGAASDGAVAPVGDGGRSALTPIVRGDAPTKTSATMAGPYKVMSYTSGFPVMLYGGGTIWYPTDAQPPFGAVAVCPGFVSAQDSIINWGKFLASHGIVVLTMDTATPLDVVDQRADELMDALASIKSENMRSGGPLAGKIDTMRLGVMGWSMGGGGTWLAANMHPELRSAVSFAGHIVTALNQDVSKNVVPTLLMAGSADTAILGGGMSQPVYDQIPASTPKMVWEVMGAGHDVANDPAGTSGAIGRYGLSWQKVFLEGDERYRQFLLEMPPNASYFKTNLK